jgi:hypothetical protein
MIGFFFNLSTLSYQEPWSSGALLSSWTPAAGTQTIFMACYIGHSGADERLHEGLTFSIVKVI